MNTIRTRTQIIERLRAAKLRPTRQRLALARLLFERGDRHVTAEQLHADVIAAGMKVSLATVYNNLHQFTRAGLLREVVVDSGRSYFDTNTASHFHFFHEATGRLEDIPIDDLVLGALPQLPENTSVKRVDVIIRIR
ncbi:MAG: transcriptional repressor [Rhodospirillaceae bacterium]|nr:transcriptional repressor [Rhodospirillaceae bacterium]